MRRLLAADKAYLSLSSSAFPRRIPNALSLSLTNEALCTTLLYDDTVHAWVHLMLCSTLPITPLMDQTPPCNHYISSAYIVLL